VPAPGAIRWLGGKSAAPGNNRGTGRWVASLLPRARIYVEPFAGMLGVLLQREPAPIEIVNDLDRQVANWWRVVRDHPAELGELLDSTPDWSRPHFEEAVGLLDCDDPVRRAWACTVIWSLNFFRARNLAPTAMFSDTWLTLRSARVAQLAARIRSVRIETRDAVELIEMAGQNEDALLYCDPPYHSSSVGTCERYGADVDRDAMLAVVREAKARVAISGYPGDGWDELGWHREDRDSFAVGVFPGARASPRTECLWMNFEPRNGRLPF